MVLIGYILALVNVCSASLGYVVASQDAEDMCAYIST